MTNVQAAEKERRDSIKVERVPEPAPNVRIGAGNSPVEADAEQRAMQALDVARDWRPDLRGVNVHDDPAAAQSAASMDAAAFTRGNDVYIGAGVERGTPEGDHVLAHELAHVEQGHGADEVHRYPATALSAGGVDWAGQTAGVFRPGGGVSGGVYILTSSDTEGGVDKVVVKPIFGASGLGTKETGESLAFGDKALSSLLGISTPTSRVVKGGSAEFAQLVTICSPHQPAQPKPGTENADMWQPLSAAKSFVVMGEVPGKSVASLAEKAGTDSNAMNELYRSVLDQDFVSEMGRVCVGDILIGNNDRMIAGAMNLGNIMVSMNEGRAKLSAIDTNAVLGKKFDPSAVVAKGSTSGTMQGGFENARNDLKAGGGATRLGGFYDILIDKMKAGAPPKSPDEQGLSAVEIFEQAYKQQKPALFKAFEMGWSDALLDVFALVNTKEGRAKMKALTDEAKGTEAGEDLDYTALKLNAGFLASRAEGKDEDEAAAELGALAGAKLVASFDTNAIVIPVDQFHHDAAARPSSEAYTADLDHPAALGAPRTMVDVMKVKNKSYDPAKLATLGTNVGNAKVEVAAIGTKSRGVVKKKEQPRNRTIAGTFVASSYLVGGGASRVVASAYELSKLVEAVAMGAGGKLKPNQAAAMLPAARFAKSYATLLDGEMQSYSDALKEDARGVAKIKKYDRRAEVADTLTKIGKYVDDSKARWMGDITTKNPQALVDALAAAAKKPA